MNLNNLITEDDTQKQDLPENKAGEGSEQGAEKPVKKKRKRLYSALPAVAKARNEAIHSSGHSTSDGGLHPTGTNITYKKGEGIL
jgi:hypothetical protein